MHRMLYQKLTQATQEFLRNQQGVTAIEYAVIAVTLIGIVAVIFNPTSGPLYDALIQAKDSMIAALSDNT